VTTRTFAAWVQPVADRLRESRAQVLAFARSQPEEAWATPSTLDGWTCKDLLAHVGKGNDMMLQDILRAVITGRHLNRSIFAVDTDGENKRRVEERRERSVAEVMAEVAEAGDEVQELLSQLTEAHEAYTQDQPPFVLSGFMQLVEREDHDLEHLAQLRSALEDGS